MLEIREQEHHTLQFKSFSNIKALELGLRLVDVAKEKQSPVTIDIQKNNQQIFHFAFEGTSKDNDEWIKRKNRIVNHFGKSSIYIKELLNEKKISLEEMFFIDSSKFSAFGGAFPIIIEDTGVIGTITVSGLPDEEDHNLVVSVIEEYMR